MLRAFVSFASEDMWARDFLVRQSQFNATPWTFTDNSLREDLDDATWKKHVRRLIQNSDLLVLLIGEETHLAHGASWEVGCARKLSLPIFGMQIRRDSPGRIPDCMRRIPVIDWDFNSISAELDRAYAWHEEQQLRNTGTRR
ncbi:TIR domain-containing protein [Pyxidicoccus caerfyrddinensis]|uniref:TIR domain-containing protein n=1 Tax=Pyxidicoccus caerfyrddinensis TaxID=2709663 RepID=UPI0013DB05E3|nr:TIR domain-containing protein [Pyxidicoccus caerfyrddinensis]